jgi:acyl-CoA thioesterase-2
VSDLLAELIEILELESRGDGVFLGRSERDRHGRVYGGQSLAQALVSAARTGPGWPVHSLHAYFLEPGDPREPILYRVEPLQRTRSFLRCRVTASQGERAVLAALASLQPLQSGPQHQQPMPAAPDPESLPTPEALVAAQRERIPAETRPWIGKPRAIEMRHVEPPAALGGRGEARNQAWFRAPGPVGDDPLLHQALIAYASDLSFNDNAARPHARAGTLGVRMASLDHALWFHAPARADRWLLYAMRSPRAAGARGLVEGSIYDRDGVHVASVAQECLMRARSGPEDAEPD